MFWSRSFARALIGLMLGMAILPAALVLSRQEAPPVDEASPASRHAQVIAHGVAEMPAREIGWRVDVKRAMLANRGVAERLEVGFALASDGPIAISDEQGKVLSRLAPGEAAWIDGSPRAIVSLAGRPIDYIDVALIPAQDGDRSAATHDPFTAPIGVAFDIDLIRDVLNRGEESVIPAGSGPMLILVTNGRVFVGVAGGELAEIAAGDSAQAAGDVVITGAGRAPASFVAARIGTEAPLAIPLREGHAAPLATPMGAATPVASPNARAAASITIAAFYCRAGYAARDFAAECTDPAPGVTFDLAPAAGTTKSSPVSDDGTLVFSRMAPGDITIDAEIPGELATSRVSCRNPGGDEVFTDVALNQASLTVDADGVACDWFILLVGVAGEDADADGDGLSDARELMLGALPFLPDSDDDGLNDSDEADFYGTDPIVADTDKDDLDDGEEVLTYATNPLIADTDGDDVADASEIAAASDPLDPLSAPATAIPTASPVRTSTPVPAATPGVATPAPRHAAMPLPWNAATPESALPITSEHASPATLAASPVATPAPAFTASAAAALDSDGLATLDEVVFYATNPLIADTDGDGVEDGAEIAAGTDPLDAADR